MQATCQRCHESLRQEDRYCSVCGLPQLTYSEAEATAVPFGPGDHSLIPVGSAALAEFSSPGIAWRPALHAAALLAIPAVFLLMGLLPVSVLLSPLVMAGAAAWAVSLYGKRARVVRISIGTGARIGLITGLFVSWLVFGVNGITIWSARFLQHQGGEIDNELRQMIAQFGTTGPQTPESTQVFQIMRGWMLTPEGRVGLILSLLLFSAGFLLLFSTLGGAIGARFLPPRRQPSA